MPSLLTCPSCSRKLRVPPELMGQRVKCPECGCMFEGSAEGPSPAEEPEAPPANEERPENPPASPTGIQAGPAAGRPLGPEEDREERDDEDEDERPWERRRRHLGRMDSEPHRGTVILVLGILGLVLGVIGLPMAIIAWVLGHNDLKKIRAGAMDPEGEGLTQAGRICGIIGTIWQGFLALGCIGYFALVMTFMYAAVRVPPPAPPISTPMPAPPVKDQAVPDRDVPAPAPAPPKAKQAPSAAKSPDQGTGRRPEGSTKK